MRDGPSPGDSGAGAEVPRETLRSDAAPRAGGAPGDPRLAAYRVLRDVDGGAPADRAADRRFAGLPPRERRLATELAYGSIRLRGRLDHELRTLVDRPLGRTEPEVLDWLRLGLYQLRELRVPAHAAVDETVEGVRRTVGRRATGFVNGVLRAATRVEDRRSLFPALEEDPVEHLTRWGSHPEWLVRRWLARWRLEEVAELVELDNRAPDVTLRLLDGEGEEARRRAAEVGATLEALTHWPRCVRLAGGDPTAVLERIPAVVQDPAASAVVDYVGPVDGGPVLDACSAPGGKCVALARAWPDARPLVAGDLRPHRIRRVVEAAERLDVSPACVVMDGRAPPLERARLVLLDAPCTGTGTLRRRPDARWRVDAARLEALTSLQRELLDGCAGVVEPGGTLVYATCSLEPEENEEQVEAFLERNPEFERAPAPPGDGDLPAEARDGRGDLRVLPWQWGTDGSYAARLRRRPR